MSDKEIVLHNPNSGYFMRAFRSGRWKKIVNETVEITQADLKFFGRIFPVMFFNTFTSLEARKKRLLALMKEEDAKYEPRRRYVLVRRK